MKCSKCNIEFEEGFLANNSQNWGKGKPLGKKPSEKITGGKSVSVLRCPTCGEIKFYTTENLV